MWSIIDGAAENLRFLDCLLLKFFETNELNTEMQKPAGNPLQGGFPEVFDRFLAAPSLTDQILQTSEKVKKEINI